MSDGSRVGLGWVREVTPGTTPASPNFQEIKLTGTSDFGFTPETTSSEVIRPDRQNEAPVLINGSVGGQYDTEMISNVHDEMLRGVLFADADWTSEVSVVTTGTSVTITGDSPVAGQSTIDEVGAFGSVAVGDWVEVKQGSADPSYYRVTDVPDADSIVVEGVVSEATGSDIDIVVGGSITNGVTKQYYTFEKSYNDHTPITYEYLRGNVPSTFSLTVSASALVTAAFGFVGFSHEVTEARVSGSGDTPVDGVGFNASSNIATIGEGGNPDNCITTEMSIEIDNGLRENTAIGKLGAAEIGAGTFTVTGSLQTYFDDKTLLEKLINQEETSISFGFTDGSGVALIVDFPAVKFTEGVPEVAGKNEDVLLNLSFEAYRSTVTGYTMKITRFTA